jgi:hypothetical protein
MIKQETFKLLKKIAAFYDQFVIDQEKVDLWHEVLKRYSFDEVQKNLFSYVAKSCNPPCLYDLVHKQEGSRTIPNAEETKILLIRNYVPASEEVVQDNLAKMRAILGIKRGQENEQI